MEMKKVSKAVAGVFWRWLDREVDLFAARRRARFSTDPTPVEIERYRKAAAADVTPAAVIVDRAIRDIASERGLSYPDAFQALQRERPELLAALNRKR